MCVQQFWAGDLGDYRYVPAHEIAEAFYAIEHGAAILRELEAPFDTTSGSHAELATHRYGQAWRTLFRANLHRQATLVLRNAPFSIIQM